MHPHRLSQGMNENALNRRIRKMIRSLNVDNSWVSTINMDGISNLADSTQPVYIRVMWIVLIMLCAVTCFYQCYDRVCYYLSEPVAVSETLVKRKISHFPTLTVCAHDTEMMGEIRRECDWDNWISLAKINPMFNLLECVSSTGMEYKTLWNSLNASLVTHVLGIINDKEVQLDFTRKGDYQPMGLCLRGELTATNKPVDGIILKIRCPIKECYQMVYIMMQENNTITDQRVGIMARPLSITRIMANFKRYVFVNRRADSCIDALSMLSCHEDCRLHYFKKAFNCRLPHFPIRMDAPPCGAHNIRELFKASVQLGFELDPVTNCSCTRKCEFYEYDGHLDYEGPADNETRIYILFSSAFITEVSEQIAYDFLSLLCDIGGNLGLNVGLSALSLIQLNYVLLRRIVKKKKFLPSDPIFSIVAKVYYRIEKSNNANKFFDAERIIQYPTFTTLVKVVIWIVCAGSSCLFIYDRMLYYNMEPTRVLVTSSVNATLMYPIFTICGHSRLILQDMRRLAKKKKGNCRKLNLDLEDVLDRKKHNISEIWQRSSIQKFFISQTTLNKVAPGMVIFKQKPINESTVSLPEGNCTQFLIGSRPFGGGPANIMLVTQDGATDQSEGGINECKSTYRTLYYNAVDEPVDLKRVIQQSYGVTLTIALRIREIRRLNTSRKPCVHSDVFNTCVNDCLVSRVQKNVNCSLPYMPPMEVPVCNAAYAAKQSKKVYQEFVMKTDPIKDCGCIQRCNITLYDGTLFTVTITDMTDATILFILFRTNTVLVYSEEAASSFISLICEVGGNLGITLGLSMLSIFDYLQKMYNTLLIIVRRLIGGSRRLR